jgi:hypothetical protein
VLDHDEAVFGVLESGDEKAADKTENEDVALHGGLWRSVMEGRLSGRTTMRLPAVPSICI